MDYEKDVQINESALDLEWLNQPSLTFEYARNAALAEDRRDRAKEALELCKAEIDEDVRKNPSKYKLEKVTDKAIESITMQDKEYKQKNDAYLTAKFELNVANGAMKAIGDMRKAALENLVKLIGQQYFAGPSVPRDITWEANQKHKEQVKNDTRNQRVSEKINSGGGRTRR